VTSEEVAVERTEDCAEFERELKEHAAPLVVWDLRMVIDGEAPDVT
jgi:hypothetical protein